MRKTVLLALWVFVAASCVGHESEFARSLAVKAPAELMLINGRILTVDKNFSIQEAAAITAGRFVAVGSNGELRGWRGAHTRIVDLGGRTVIPGLIDSHIHVTAGCIAWDSELHWELTQSLAQGLRQIAAAAKTKPAGSWIVVGGGWVPTQFAERRFPTRADLDAVAPKHPVYVQYLRQGALLNTAALAAVAINRHTVDPPGGRFERDPSTGEPTGLVQGVPAWEYAYSKIPRPALDQIRRSFRNCFRELNRLGITSVVDLQTADVTFAHRRLLSDMARTRELTLRLNYYVAPSEDGDELEQLRIAAAEVKQLVNDEMFRFGGFGETLVRGTEDGDVLANPKGITIDRGAKKKFRDAARFVMRGGYNLHLHTTQDNTAKQLLDVLEQLDQETPLARQRVAFAHLEAATPETIARIVKLGGGISVQDRLLLTGERNLQLWGAKARNAPPLRSMLDARVPLGAGTDAFRSGNYSPMYSSGG
jgi:predicted amidohydrolase YtcJ